MDSLDLNNKITHWISQDKTLQYSDPALEDYSEDIRTMVSEDTLGLFDSEIEFKHGNIGDNYHTGKRYFTEM